MEGRLEEHLGDGKRNCLGYCRGVIKACRYHLRYCLGERVTWSGAPVGSPRGRGLGLCRPKRRVRTRSPLLHSWRSQSWKKKKSKTQIGACALCACLCCGPAPRPLVLQPPRFALSGGGGCAASNGRLELKVRCAGPPPPPHLSHHLGVPHLPPKANGSACGRTRPGGREQKTRRRASGALRGKARPLDVYRPLPTPPAQRCVDPR